MLRCATDRPYAILQTCFGLETALIGSKPSLALCKAIFDILLMCGKSLLWWYCCVMGHCQEHGKEILMPAMQCTEWTSPSENWVRILAFLMGGWG